MRRALRDRSILRPARRRPRHRSGSRFRPRAPGADSASWTLYRDATDRRIAKDSSAATAYRKALALNPNHEERALLSGSDGAPARRFFRSGALLARAGAGQPAERPAPFAPRVPLPLLRSRRPIPTRQRRNTLPPSPRDQSRGNRSVASPGGSGPDPERLGCGGPAPRQRARLPHHQPHGPFLSRLPCVETRGSPRGRRGLPAGGGGSRHTSSSARRGWRRRHQVGDDGGNGRGRSLRGVTGRCPPPPGPPIAPAR